MLLYIWVNLLPTELVAIVVVGGLVCAVAAVHSCERGPFDENAWAEKGAHCPDPRPALARLKASGRKGGWECADGSRVACQASGDLDEDGVYSLFERVGVVQAVSGSGWSYEAPGGIIKRWRGWEGGAAPRSSTWAWTRAT